MKLTTSGFLLAFLALFSLLLFGCIGAFRAEPPTNFGGGEEIAPSEQPQEQGQLPPGESQPETAPPREYKTADQVSTISMQRQVTYATAGNGQSWTYVESVEVRGKFQQLALTDYDYANVQAKYKLVDSTVTWKVNNDYSISSTSPRGTTGSLTCINSEIVTGSGTDKLENLDISYAIGEPAKLPEAGELILELKKDGTYKLDGRFFATVTDTERNTCGGERVNPNSIQYRLPVVGTYAVGKTISRSGSFANVGCLTQECYTDPNAFTLMIAVDPMSTDIPEEKGTWTAGWNLYLP